MSKLTSGEFMNGVHRIAFRVYYEDTDAAGIMYYANYLKFAERARTEALRLMGLPHAEIVRDHGAGFVVRRCEADYLSPARLEDIVTVETSLQENGASRMTMRQKMMVGNVTAADLRLVLACVGKDMKPVRIPDHVLRAIETYLTLQPE